MNSFREGIHSWVTVVISVVTWIIILSFMLSFLFEAGISGGWVIAGALISIAAFGGLLLTKELTEAILSPEFTVLSRRMAVWNRARVSRKPRRRAAMTGGKSSFVEMRRATLGLCARGTSNGNRLKTVRIRRKTDRLERRFTDFPAAGAFPLG